MDKSINDHINSLRDSFISDLKTLVEINSVRTEAKPGMPFGEGGAKALKAAEKIAKSHGFKFENLDNYAGEISVGKTPVLMLLSHLDTVPAGDGWTKEPFALTVENDLAYGRGTTDDKGAAVACLYALKTCTQLFGEPKKGVKIVFGSGEETGSEDMEHYFSLRPTLKYTLTPDADYPLINIEKGRFAPVFTKSVNNGGNRVITELCGGDTLNIVPAKAYAVVSGITQNECLAIKDSIEKATGAAFQITNNKDKIRIDCFGAGAHAATPKKGINAQTALILYLNALKLDKNELTSSLYELIKLFPHRETNGESAGVKMSDAESGELTLNFGVLSYFENELTAGLDLRCPVKATDSTVTDVIVKAMIKAGFLPKGEPKLRPAHCVAANSPLIKELLSVYESYTGKKGECKAIGGGTYVHNIEGGVAFGIEFDGKDYRIHGADEYCVISELLLTAKMYAQIIKDLCY